MKIKANHSISLLLSTFTLLCGLVVCVADEVEPNNTRAQANALTLNADGTTPSAGRIISISDLDVFRVTTPTFSGQKTLTVFMQPTSSDAALDAWVQLLDASGNVVAERDSGGDNATEILTFTRSTGNSTYFIVCRSADVLSSGTGSYLLVVAFDDLNDQISDAMSVGAMGQTMPKEGVIDSPTDADMYAIVVQAGQRISFDIDITSRGFDSYLCLFDANGTRLAANDNASGPGETIGLDSYLEYTFNSSGTFFLGVSGHGNANYNAISGAGDSDGSTGSYTLVFSPGLAGTIRRPGDPNDYRVNLLRFGQVPSAILSHQRTWLVIHGWRSSRSEPNISDLANSLSHARPGDQILTLDWSEAADTLITNPFDAEDSIVPVAEWAAAVLANYGFSGMNLNIVGHSFGSYVADEIAERMPGSIVNTIVGLDPAEDIPFADAGYDPNVSVDFGLHSTFSWAFYSSATSANVLLGLADGNEGNEQTPTTADEAFVVKNTSHGDLVVLFAAMLWNPLNPLNQLFSLNLLLAGVPGPWVPDQWGSNGTPGGRYEAVITAEPSGKVAQSIQFITNAPILNITSPATGITISESPIILSGTATDAGRGGSGIASVQINGVRSNNDTASGSGIAYWNQSVALSPGTNFISVVAWDNGSKPGMVTNILSVNYIPATSTPPNLAIAFAPGLVRLSWPAEPSGFVLQQTAEFSEPVIWNLVLTSVTTFGRSNMVVIPRLQANQFFRLKGP